MKCKKCGEERLVSYDGYCVTCASAEGVIRTPSSPRETWKPPSVMLTMRAIDPDEGDLMTLQEFRDGCVRGGIFTNDDGIGRYATVQSVSTVFIRPSDSWMPPPSPQLTHVVWYNK